MPWRGILAGLIVFAMLVLGALTGYHLMPDAQMMAASAGDLPALSAGTQKLALAGGTLEAPEYLISRIEQPRHGGSRVDMLVPLAGLKGIPDKSPSRIADFSRYLLLALEENTEKVLPARKIATIYRRYMTGRPRRAPGHLVEYRFAPDSPYGDITLYVGALEGQPMFIRCDNTPSTLGPVLCEGSFRPAPKLRATFRFAREHLAKWAEITIMAKRIVALYYHS